MYVFVSEDHILELHSCQICYPLEIKLLLLLLLPGEGVGVRNSKGVRSVRGPRNPCYKNGTDTSFETKSRPQKQTKTALGGEVVKTF